MRLSLNWINAAFLVQKTKNRYALPLPENGKIKNILYDWPSHEGPFKGAVDFAVDLNTPVLAPLDGHVIEIVDRYDKYGPSQEFAPFLNYITIAHDNGEYCQVAHIKKGSVKVHKGQLVKKGQQLAVTGLNGWMEEPFLEHLHFFVFRLLNEGSFRGLKIRFENPPKVSE